MKKILLIAAIALMAVAFVSCKKDGVYNPKHKIAKVSEEWTRTSATTDASGTVTHTVNRNPYVAEEWTWSDKTLASITYKNFEGKVYETVKYTYDDKNRIIGSTNADGDEKAEYVYNDDKKLQSIKITNGTHNEVVMEIAYDGKVPTTITTTVNYTLKNLSKFAKSVIPSYIYNAIEADEVSAKAATVTHKYTSAIEWDGKNIIEVVTTGEDNYKHIVKYEYDGKLNPNTGMYANMDNDIYNEYGAIYSKNNVIKRTETYSNGTTTEEKYEYQYDGKMPIKVIYTDVDEYEILGTKYNDTTVYTTTYEYTK